MTRRRRIAIAGSTLLVGLLGGAGAPGASADAGGIVDLPVHFTVENIGNRSKAPCDSDAGRYTIAGDLVAPASVLNSEGSAVTLYVHGSGAGSFWHFKAVPGLDYANEMARLGHTSLVIDQLGYGQSDIPNGEEICFGSAADIIHQVVGQLTDGTYDAGPHQAPTFRRIALAGHSGGAFIAELEAHSFRDIDALIVAGWVDHPAALPLALPLIRIGTVCATGGEPKYGDHGPTGYAFGFSPDEIRRNLFYNAAPEAVEAYVAAFERDFCFGDSGAQTVAANQLFIPTITVPTLLVYGDHDLYSPLLAEGQRARYQGSDDVSLAIIGDAGHSLTLQRTAPQFRAVMSGWLRDRGF